jgi:hypothetical protein
MKLTPDQNYSSQALVLDPTTPGHIHLRAPGATIDEPIANVYLGGEASSFEVGVFNGAAPNLFVHSGNNTWGFDNAGNLTLPGNTFAINYANGNAVPIDNVANANYANFAGNAYAVDGANVSGTVANATFALDAGNANIANIAYSVDAANVSGLGNIATINLDGNVSNLLTGNGTFVAIPTDVANANYANYAGTVLTNAQPNITSVGNLVAFTVNSNTANSTTVQVNGNLISYANSNYYGVTTAYNAGSGIGARGSQAFVIVNPNEFDYVRNDYYSNKSGNAKMAYSEVTVDANVIGNSGTDPFVPGSVGWYSYTSSSNLANISTQTGTSFNLGGGGLNVLTGTGINVPALSFSVFGNAAGGTGQQGIRFRRRGGNNDSRTNVAANYYLGNIEWQGAATVTGGFTANSTTARVSAKVESTYANTGPIPTALEFQVSNGTTSTHNFHANGSVAFQRTVSTGNGNITLNSTGTIDYLRTFGSFTSNATQTSNGANTTNFMTFNNTEDANGVSIVSSTQLTVARTGRYNIQFSAQASHDVNQTANLEIWLTKNGTAVANTNGRVVLIKDQPMIAAWNFVDNVSTANTYYQLAWASPDTNVELTAFDTANTIAGVAIPSIIATITPVGA